MKKPLKGYDGWFVTDEGRVFHGEKEIHPYKTDKRGGLAFDVARKKRVGVMQAVYNSFNDTDYRGNKLYHINGDIADNRLKNIGVKEKHRPVYVRKNPVAFNSEGKIMGNYCKVYCEETDKEYISIKECCKDLGITAVDANYAIYSTKGDFKTKWHIWRIKDLENE